MTIGIAIQLAPINTYKNSLDNTQRIIYLSAPNTLWIAISRVFKNVIKEDSPKIPIQARKMAKREKTINTFYIVDTSG